MTTASNEIFDFNSKSQMPQTIPEDSTLEPDNTMENIRSTIPKEMEENEEFNKVIGHENQIRWLERKVENFFKNFFFNIYFLDA